MNTVATKRITSLRLNADLYASIETLAKSENRSVNNFIETALSKVIDLYTPNEETVKAIEEMRKERSSLKRYDNVKDLFKDLEKA